MGVSMNGGASPFSQAAIQTAVAQALTQTPLPPGKTAAIVAMVTTEGIRAVVVAKFDDHWTATAEVEYHGGAIAGGVSVVASW
jgi:hypothetical protein